MKKYVVLDKQIGQTPLECMETWRKTQSSIYDDVPLTYAGRLDPMASGALLVLIGTECKHKDQYLGLDKAYTFEILLGTQSDSADILGLIKSESMKTLTSIQDLKKAAREFVGDITLPYPAYSSKPVAGKPLHQWSAEGAIDQIDIPTKTSRVYKLKIGQIRSELNATIYDSVLNKINSLATVTDKRKAMGRNFRRNEILESWKQWQREYEAGSSQIVTVSCVASSGTYMRTLAEQISQSVGTVGLAYNIRRTQFGQYRTLPLGLHVWSNTYRIH